jgi:hypothetical protein
MKATVLPPSRSVALLHLDNPRLTRTASTKGCCGRGARPDTAAGVRTFLSAATSGRLAMPAVHRFAANPAADRNVRAPGLVAASRCVRGKGHILLSILLFVSGMALAQAAPSVATVPQTTQTQTSADVIPPDADLAAYAAIALAQGKVIISPGTFPPPAKGFTHYLVTLKPDADPHQWDQELSPTHHYSHALKGFRAQLTAEQYKKLKAHKQVVAIEPDTAIRPAVVSKGPAHPRLVPLSIFH